MLAQGSAAAGTPLRAQDRINMRIAVILAALFGAAALTEPTRRNTTLIAQRARVFLGLHAGVYVSNRGSLDRTLQRKGPAPAGVELPEPAWSKQNLHQVLDASNSSTHALAKTPCIDASARTDLASSTKMQIMKMNDDLEAQSTAIRAEITDLRNRYGALQAARVRIETNTSQTHAWCESRRQQTEAHERWVEAEMDMLRKQCASAETLSDAEFQS